MQAPLQRRAACCGRRGLWTSSNNSSRPVATARALRRPSANHHARVNNAPPAAADDAAPQPLVTRVLQSAGHLALAASLLLSPLGGGASAEEGGTILRLPASENPEVYAAQQTLMEAWSLVGDSFVDESFNGHWWPEELKRHMMAAYASSSGAAAYGEIGSMLAELGDPYTRIIPPSEYADFRVSSEGELQGVGLLIANEPVNNHLLVLSAIRGSPADRAGIASGDEVIAINDQPTDGWTGDMAAKLLRGKGGTVVRLKFARRTSGIPGVPGRPEPRLEASTTTTTTTTSGGGVLPYFRDESATVREVRLRRERVALSPVYYTALQADAAARPAGFSVAAAPGLADADADDATLASALDSLVQSYSSTAPGRTPLNAAATRMLPGAAMAAEAAPAASARAAAGAAADRWGYLRLTSFSANATEETKRAILSLEHKGVSGFILDLRDNPGGLVSAGVGIARLLMDGHPTVFSIVGRAGEPEQKVTLGEDAFSAAPSTAITHKPLVVLVNNHSASASEILSGALRDNGRAVIIGDTPTYGKGRIQSVYELHDGGALFVTVAKYVTPSGTIIDAKGLPPDTSCALPGAGLNTLFGAGAAEAAVVPPLSGMSEPDALAMAAAFVPGMPVGPGAEAALVSALNGDACVLKAARVLHDKAAAASAMAPTRVAAAN